MKKLNIKGSVLVMLAASTSLFAGDQDKALESFKTAIDDISTYYTLQEKLSANLKDMTSSLPIKAGSDECAVFKVSADGKKVEISKNENGACKDFWANEDSQKTLNVAKSNEAKIFEIK